MKKYVYMDNNEIYAVYYRSNQTTYYNLNCKDKTGTVIIVEESVATEYEEVLN